MTVMLPSASLQHKTWANMNCVCHITHLLAYSMEQRSSWEANRFSTSQEIPCILWNLKVHYSSYKCFSLFCNMIRFYGELVAPRPTPNLNDHPKMAVCDCLFDIFAATLHIGGCSSIRNLRTRYAVVTGTHLLWMPHHIKPKIITYCQFQTVLNKTLTHKFEKWCKFSSYIKASTLTAWISDLNAIISLCCNHSSWQQWFTVVNIICCCCNWLAASNCW